MPPHNRFVQSYCHLRRIGVLIELATETWVVTQQDDFVDLSRNLAMHIAATNPDSVETLLHQPYVRDASVTVEQLLTDASKQFAERISITWFIRRDVEHLPTDDSPRPPDQPAAAVRLRRA